MATGVLLVLYYRPSAEEAFESVQFIMTEVQFGWLIRSIHSWSANLMIATLMCHLFSVYFTQAYRKPRELTWLPDGPLRDCLIFGFSGYLLPWNTLAYFATKVGTDVAGQIPVAGHLVYAFLAGRSGRDRGDTVPILRDPRGHPPAPHDRTSAVSTCSWCRSRG